MKKILSENKKTSTETVVIGHLSLSLQVGIIPANPIRLVMKNPSKNIPTLLLAALLALPASAGAQGSRPVFTTIKANPITPVKNQNRSGTCWDYATCGFLEAEILRATGRTVDLAEMFVAHNDYVDCADYHVRMHGMSRFSEGGSCDDVLAVIRKHGICPEEAMTAPGKLVGDTLANFNEFFSVLEPYVESVAKSTSKKITTQWRVGVESILDAYLGKCPTQFVYQGKTYTPQSFASQLGLNWDDYISVTSFTHHPFNSWCIVEAPYKWRPQASYNVPLETMMSIIDQALAAGYCVAWGGDVSGANFSRQGIGLAISTDESRDLEGSDKARWLKLSKIDQKNLLDSAGADVPEVKPTQALRQKYFDSWESTYDHVMVIYGTAKDQNGREYYMVKNSWGDHGRYHGTWYLSKSYVALYTTYIFLNRKAVSQLAHVGTCRL